MPEGDTIHKLALRMRPVLVGEVAEEVSLRDRGEIQALGGSRVSAVDAVGKHMLMHFGAGFSIRVHLGMKGRWRRYCRGESPLARRRSASVFVATAEVEYACLEASQTELFLTADLSRNRALQRVGPDLLARRLDLGEMLRRARSPGMDDRPIGELVLDQWVAAGIGNVYKSEVLFMVGVDPWTPTGEVTDEILARIYRLSRKLLHRNLREPGGRITVDPGSVRTASREQLPRLWVYGRTGEACLDCGTAIASRGQGDLDRKTYYCPRCQAPGNERPEPLIALRPTGGGCR